MELKIKLMTYEILYATKWCCNEISGVGLCKNIMVMISFSVKETWTINDIERSRKYMYNWKQHTTLILFISLPCESEKQSPSVHCCSVLGINRYAALKRGSSCQSKLSKRQCQIQAVPGAESDLWQNVSLYIVYIAFSLSQHACLRKPRQGIIMYQTYFGEEATTKMGGFWIFKDPARRRLSSRAFQMDGEEWMQNLND